MEAIRDSNHRAIGYLEHRGDKTFVRDPHYRLLGWADGRGTYDQFGRKVLDSSAPEFLLHCAR